MLPASEAVGDAMLPPVMTAEPVVIGWMPPTGVGMTVVLNG